MNNRLKRKITLQRTTLENAHDVVYQNFIFVEQKRLAGFGVILLYIELGAELSS